MRSSNTAAVPVDTFFGILRSQILFFSVQIMYLPNNIYVSEFSPEADTIVFVSIGTALFKKRVVDHILKCLHLRDCILKAPYENRGVSLFLH